LEAEFDDAVRQIVIGIFRAGLYGLETGNSGQRR